MVLHVACSSSSSHRRVSSMDDDDNDFQFLCACVVCTVGPRLSVTFGVLKSNSDLHFPVK